MANIYTGSVSYTAVTAWSTLMAGDSTVNGGRGTYVRATAPAVGSERVFRCTTTGVAAAGEPAWTNTKNATTADGTIVWTECTGQELDQVSGTWKAPHARLANATAATWGAAGDTFYVTSNHAETQTTALTIACPGTITSPCRILCVTAAGTVPPVSADLSLAGAISTTGASTIAITGIGYFYGLTFTSGSGASSASFTLGSGTNTGSTYSKCNFVLGNTSGGSALDTGSGTSRNTFLDCGFKFGAASQTFDSKGTVLIKGGAWLAGGTSPNIVFESGSGAFVSVDGFDFSVLAATLDILTGANMSGVRAFLRNCKMPASWSGDLVSAAFSLPVGRAELWNSDSTDTNYRVWVEDAFGTIKSQTATLIKTGGASDGDTPLSWKMATSANAEYPMLVLRSPEIFSERITTVGSPLTVTVDILHDSVTALKDDEIWLEVQYLGTAGFPLGTFLTDSKTDVLAAGTNQAASSATWDTTGMANPNKQKLEVTFTPQEEGIAIVTVCMAKTSYTVYVDPFDQLGTSGTSLSFMLPGAGQTNLVIPAAGGGASAHTFVG